MGLARVSLPDGPLQRAPRPLIGWAGAFLVFVLTLFVAAVCAAIALGFWMTAARGEAVPDFTGGLAVLITAIAPVAGALHHFLQNRSRERRDSIAYSGGQAPPPFQSPAGSEPDPENWPRPGGQQ